MIMYVYIVYTDEVTSYSLAQERERFMVRDVPRGGDCLFQQWHCN